MTKKVLLFSLITILVCFSVINVYATTGSYCGVGTYTLCGYGSRNGDLYVSYLSSKLSANNGLPNQVSNNYYVENSMVYPDRINNFTSFTDLFVFSGHGVRFDYDPSLNNMSTLHTYASSTSDSWHTSLSQYSTLYNLSWNEYNTNQSAKWGIFYTCNWLTNGGSATVKDNCFRGLFNGANMRLALSFGSRMYLDQREANLLGDYLRSSKTIKQAFFDAAARYQPQLNPSASTYNGYVVARVCGYVSAENDKFSSYSGTPTSYSSRPQDYFIRDSLIPCTGTLVP